MKTKEAPEKIYIPTILAANAVRYKADGSIEYVRKDAFIEKACKFLNKELPITDLSSSNMLDITFKVFDKENKKVFIENFKAYMKRECEIWESTE